MTNNSKAMRDAFLQALYTAMIVQEDIFLLTADFGSPVMDHLKKDCPKRVINVGIAEQNLINVAAGLALEGYKVFAYAIAPFITMRCYEQIRVSLAILSQQRAMNVTLIGVGAGCSYAMSGPTHQCLEDLSLMRTLPNVQVLSPSDWIQARNTLQYCLQQPSIKYLRLDAMPLPALYEQHLQTHQPFCLLNTGKRIAIVATGYMTQLAKRLCQAYPEVALIDLIQFDDSPQALAALLGGFAHVITLEEGFIEVGGLDAYIGNLLRQHRLTCELHTIGFQRHYTFEIGSRDALLNLNGCGPEALTKLLDRLSSGDLL